MLEALVPSPGVAPAPRFLATRPRICDGGGSVRGAGVRRASRRRQQRLSWQCRNCHRGVGDLAPAETEACGGGSPPERGATVEGRRPRSRRGSPRAETPERAQGMGGDQDRPPAPAAHRALARALTRTCTKTRLSAGTSSGPAPRGKASSASNSSKLKRGRRGQVPCVAGGEKGWHRARKTRCPLCPQGE